MGVIVTRKATYAQKRGIEVAAYNIVEGTDAAELDTSASENFLVGTLPENALISNAYVYVKDASDVALTGTLGTTEGGGEILTAIDFAATGDTGTFAGDSIPTDTGVEVWLNLTAAGGSTLVGEYVVVIEYIEYRLKTGYYTAFNL